MAFKFTLQQNNKDTKRISNMTFQRIAMYVVFASDPSAAVTPPDLTKWFLKGVLVRGGREYQIFNESMEKLQRAMGYFTSSFQAVLNFTTGSATGSQWVVPFCLDLGEPINLTGDDVFIFEVRQDSGWSGSTTGTPYISYNFRDTIGNGTYIPIWQFQLVQGGQNQWAISLGNGVKQLGAFSTQTGFWYTAATQIFTNIRIESDKVDLDEDNATLYARILDYFEFTSTGIARGNNVMFKFDFPLNNANINLTLQGSVVTANNTWVGFMTAAFTKDTLMRSGQRAIRHENENAKVLKAAMGQ